MARPNFTTQEHFDLYLSEMQYQLLDEDDNEIDEYEFDEWLYEETLDYLKELNKNLNFFKITLISGNYAGIQTYIEEQDDYFSAIELIDNYDWYNGKDFYQMFGKTKYIMKRQIEKEIKEINQKLLPLLKLYTFDRYGITAQFSNGETFYGKY